MAYYRNYPVLAYRDDDVDDVLNIDYHFDSNSDNLNRELFFKKNSISLLVVNIRSCHSNFDKLIIFLKSIAMNFDMIILTET